MRIKFLLILCIVFSFGITSVSAISQRHFYGNPEFIRFNDKELPDFSQLTSVLNNYGFTEPYNLSLINTETDQLGMVHYRYMETYNGVPVEGTMWIVHTKGNKIKSMNGVLYAQLPAANAQIYDLRSCYNIALQHIPAQYYYNDSVEGELYWASQNNSGNPQQFRLCYRFNIYAAIPLQRKYVFVDVTTGKVIADQNLIVHANATGTAVTAYSGAQTITTDFTGGTYRLRETGRGKGIETYNMNKGTDYNSAVDFTDTDNYWNNVNSNLDQYATDAHWGTEKTYDFYFINFGRNSIDNNGLKLRTYVHANLTGMGFSNNVNAFWDGSRMTYGDGNSTYSPLTSIEITGHEITHGLTQYTSGLKNGEAGALNEGFSDCMGNAIRYYAKPGATINWLIGDEIGGTAFRDMSNPDATGNPDTYKGTNWDFATEEVHQNSTVLSYCFYLLTEGGTGTNDFNSVFNISGLGINKATAIWYRMNTVYLFPTSTYADARTFSIQSAADLYGPCSPEVIAVTDAWYAVGVGAAYSILPVTADFTVNATSSCSVPFTVKFTNASTGGGSYLWSFGDGSVSTDMNPVHSFSSAGNFAVTLINEGNDCGSDSVTKPDLISVQQPVNPSGADVSRCGSGAVTLHATASGTINWYDNQSGGTVVGTGEDFTTPTLNNTTSYYAEASITPSPVLGGLPDNTTGSGSNFDNNTSRYLIFNCASPVTLVSVKVYATGAGSRTIQLRRYNGVVLQTITTYLPDGESTVTLNFNVPAENNLNLSIKGTANLYRNTTGAVYPMNIGNYVTLTGTNSGAGQEYYYYFYNWKIQEPDCISNRTEIKAIINPAATASVNITTSPSLPVCAGTTVNFSATAINGGAAPAFQWKVNGNNAGDNSMFFSDSTLKDNDVVTCVVTSDAACVTGSPATSAPVTVQLTPVPVSSIATNDPTTFCMGEKVTLTNSAEGFSYQWMNRDVPVSGATDISYTASIGGKYTCKAFNSCGAVVSNAIRLTRNPLPAATITLQGTNPLCTGKKDTLSTPYGTSWSYQWTRNNNNINGATNAEYRTRVGGTFRVLVTDKITGCSKLSPRLRITVSNCRDEYEFANSNDNPIVVYPNPFSHSFMINTNTIHADKIEVYDILGKTVEVYDIPDDVTLFSAGETLIQGIYFLKVWEKDKVTVTMKLVKAE